MWPACLATDACQHHACWSCTGLMHLVIPCGFCMQQTRHAACMSQVLGWGLCMVASMPVAPARLLVDLLISLQPGSLVSRCRCQLGGHLHQSRLSARILVTVPFLVAVAALLVAFTACLQRAP